MASIELFGAVHSAQRQMTTQISIEFSVMAYSHCTGSRSGPRQGKETVPFLYLSRSRSRAV